MTTRRLLTLMLLAAAAACSGDAAGSSPTAQAKSIADVPSPSMNEMAGCSRLAGTVYGQFDPNQGWVGDAQVSIDGGAPEHATFVDAGTDALKGHVRGYNELDEIEAGRRFWGTETLTLTFSDNATLAEDASFVGVPSSTPYLYELHETGALSGTGRFATASGHVAVDGPFLNPLFISPPPWVASITGSICN